MSLVGSLSGKPFLGSIDWAHAYIGLAAFLVCVFVAFTALLSSRKSKVDYNNGVFTYVKFVYATFFKPHDNCGDGQQGALESFYKTQVYASSCSVTEFPLTTAQATAYDSTRRHLLRGREDMLGLVAAQLKFKADSKEIQPGKAIWVDIGGGTG